MYKGTLIFLKTAVGKTLPYTMDVNILSSLQAVHGVCGRPAVVIAINCYSLDTRRSLRTVGYILRLHRYNTILNYSLCSNTKECTVS